MIATMPQVEKIQSIQSIAPQEVTKRLTIEDAAAKLLKECPLASPKDSFQDFIQDLKASLDQATDFINEVANDLSFLGELDYNVEPLTLNLHEKSCDNIADRYKIAYDMFTKTVNTKLNNLINVKSERGSVPEFSKVETKGDTCTFQFITGWNKYEDITFLNWSYKSCDDFTRKIPKQIQRKIDYLRGTKYDYRPMILDGYLANKTTHQLPVPKLDPALTILFRGENRVVYFWEE